MDITICENLKDYRRNKGNTQEELAEFIGISIQAVSKWERGESYPDITLLPKIAAYYNVSVDDLLGVGKMQTQKKIDEYQKKSDELQRKGDDDGNLELWTEALKEFPNNYGVLHGYLMSFYQKAAFGGDSEEFTDEIIKTAERLFSESDDEQHRYDVIWILCPLYKRLGNMEKAIEYANKAPGLDITRHHLLTKILKGEEAVNLIQSNLCCYTELMWQETDSLIHHGNFRNEERRKAHQYQLKLFELLFEDGDYGFYCSRLSSIYFRLALCDAADKETDSVINNLSLSAEYSIKFETQPGFRHTSLLVNQQLHKDGHHGYPNTQNNECLKILNAIENNGAFDFCREDARVKAIEKNLKKFAKNYT